MLKILSKIQTRLRQKPETSDALYDLVMNSSAGEKKKIIQKAIRQANEDQRKIYYGTATTK